MKNLEFNLVIVFLALFLIGGYKLMEELSTVQTNVHTMLVSE